MVPRAPGENLVIEGTLDSRDLERALDDIARRASHARPLFQELISPARKDQKDHKRQRSGPDRPWAAHAPATTLRRSRGRKRRRVNILGRLPSLIKAKADRDGITLTSKVKWSGIHQEGGTAGRGSRIPKRSFLWWSEAFLGTAADAALRYVTRDWSKSWPCSRIWCPT